MLDKEGSEWKPGANFPPGWAEAPAGEAEKDPEPLQLVVVSNRSVLSGKGREKAVSYP
jgi:hypothetical protein